jgi:hypothetical protein
MTKQEALVIACIILLTGVLTYFNLQQSQVLARDFQRKEDLRSVKKALDVFRQDFGFYPASKDGRILACGTKSQPVSCEWGKDALADVSDPSYPPYLDLLPQDPLAYFKQYHYVYISDKESFLLLAHLENTKDDEYSKEVEEKGIACGPQVFCNFAVGSGKTQESKE